MIMDWLLKLKRALLAFNARLNSLKQHKAVALGGEGDDQCGGVGGLLKLQDDVQMCAYQDVQIMWNMLSKAQQEEIQIMATTDHASPTELNLKQRKRKQGRLHSSSIRTFFESAASQSCVLVRLQSNACSIMN